MQNQQTTSKAVRNWITDCKLLAATEKTKHKATSAAGRGNNDPPATLHIVAWFDLVECFEEHENLLKTGGQVSTLYLKPPPHVAGVALEKTEHAGIEHKDDGDEARKAVMHVVKERKSGMKRDHQEMSRGGKSRTSKPHLFPNSKGGSAQSHGEDIAILVRDLMEAGKQSAQKHVKGEHLKQLIELRSLSTDKDKKAAFTALIKTGSFVSDSKTSNTTFASKPLSSQDDSGTLPNHFRPKTILGRVFEPVEPGEFWQPVAPTPQQPIASGARAPWAAAARAGTARNAQALPCARGPRPSQQPRACGQRAAGVLAAAVFALAKTRCLEFTFS